MAPDGGLYMPCSIPAIPRALFNNIGDMNLREIAFIVASSFLGEDLPSHDIKALVDETFREDTPMKSQTFPLVARFGKNSTT